MDTELQAIRDAWDEEIGGRDEALTLALSDQYVADHPEYFTQMQNMSIQESVQAVDVFRAAGMLDDQWRVQAWLHHHWAPQHVGGPVAAVVRITQSGN